VNHIVPITRGEPASADAFQEIACQIAQMFSGILSAFGGTSPILGYVTEKCDLPGQPPGEEETTEPTA